MEFWKNEAKSSHDEMREYRDSFIRFRDRMELEMKSLRDRLGKEETRSGELELNLELMRAESRYVDLTGGEEVKEEDKENVPPVRDVLDSPIDIGYPEDYIEGPLPLEELEGRLREILETSPEL